MLVNYLGKRESSVDIGDNYEATYGCKKWKVFEKSPREVKMELEGEVEQSSLLEEHIEYLDAINKKEVERLLWEYKLAREFNQHMRENNQLKALTNG